VQYLQDILEDKRHGYTNAGEVLQDCMTCYARSLSLYETVSSELGVAKVRLRMAKTQIDYLFSPVALLDLDPIAVSLMPTSIAKSERTEDVSLALSKLLDIKYIDNEYIAPALHTAVHYSAIFVTIDAYITQAELRHFQARTVSSKAFWIECKRLVYEILIVNGQIMVANEATPSFLEKLRAVMQRLVRLLFVYDRWFINQHLSVIDAYFEIQSAVERSLKRTINLAEGALGTEVGSSSGSESREAEDTDTQNRIYQGLFFARGKVLPFLKSARRRKVASPRLNKPASDRKSRNRSPTTLAQEAWNYIFMMKKLKQNPNKEEIAQRNKQSAQKLYAMMTTLHKTDTDKEPPIRSIHCNQVPASGLVYLQQIADVVICYIPNTGVKEFKRFGGRKRTHFKPPPPPLPASPKPTRSASSSPTEIRDPHQRPKSQRKSEEERNVRARNQQMFGTGTTQLDNEMYHYLNTEFKSFTKALLLEKKNKKGTNVLDQRDETIEFLRTSMFQAPWDYRPIEEKENYSAVSSTMLVVDKKPKSKKDTPKLESLKIVQYPLRLIISRQLHLIPFELMFDHMAVRVFTDQPKYKDRNTPTFFCFYSEDEERFIAPVERQRKEWAFQRFLRATCRPIEQPTTVFQSSLPNVPLHFPLVRYSHKPKRKKFESVKFIKMSRVVEDADQILFEAKNVSSPNYPIFLFTLTDLVDPCDLVWNVMRSDFCAMFIADATVGDAIRVIMDLQSTYVRNGQLGPNSTPKQGYQFFAHCLQTLKQMSVPVITINPPW
jgi:hypothetical protein